MRGFSTLIMLALFAVSSVVGQVPTNIFVTKAEADQILKGNYNPLNYTATQVISDHHQIICDAISNVSTDSLYSYIRKLGTFHNRNSGSDTVSATTGIGAARRWAHSKFESFSAVSEDRLLTSYLQFDQVICGMSEHRDIFTVLPGSDTADKSIIIIEGHIDSRCEDGCDITCKAHGIEDNASGSALVMELARVMSSFTFKHTIVFMLTIAEEQGLYGANAFAQYCEDNGIQIRAVQNNDVVGGIYCGATSSPPSCPFEDHIDSTHVRIFSQGTFSQLHRSLARSIKIFNQEQYAGVASVPMKVRVMNQEDRTGRAGDHIPFRQRGYTAIRFCSANEHGNADASNLGYTDRQHTVRDTLGADTNGDGVVDSFFVDFNYLRRNSVLNAVTTTMISEGPETPGIQVANNTSGITVTISSQTQYSAYRIGVRPSDSTTNFEAVYTIQDTLAFVVPGIVQGSTYFISAASVGSNGIMSIFSEETLAANASVSSNPGTPTVFSNQLNCNIVGVEKRSDNSAEIASLTIEPNPASTQIHVVVTIHQDRGINNPAFRITNITGQVVYHKAIILEGESADSIVNITGLAAGVYICAILSNREIIQSKKLVIQK